VTSSAKALNFAIVRYSQIQKNLFHLEKVATFSSDRRSSC